jgi:hypothetical protein
MISSILFMGAKVVQTKKKNKRIYSIFWGTAIPLSYSQQESLADRLYMLRSYTAVFSCIRPGCYCGENFLYDMIGIAYADVLCYSQEVLPSEVVGLAIE